MSQPAVTNPSASAVPVILTPTQRDELLSLLALVPVDSPDDAAARASELRAAIAGQRVDEPSYEYVLAGPWGTISEGDGSLEATIAGCRDARRQHWAAGHGRDERYDSIRVLGYPTTYVYDADDDDLGRFIGPDQVIPVDDDALTDNEQAESTRRITKERADLDALYAHLREHSGLRSTADAATVEDTDTN